MIDRALLARYLRQRIELGERELMLDELTAKELMRALAAQPGGAAGPIASAGTGPAPGPTSPEGGTRTASAPSAEAASPAEATARLRTPVVSGAIDAAARSALIREALGGGVVASVATKAGYSAQPAAAASPARVESATQPSLPPAKMESAREAEIPVSPRPRVPVSAASPGRPAAAREPTEPVAPSRPPALPPSDAARPDAAPAASALQVLSMEAAACTACRLATSGRRQTVFGRGDPAARLVVVGEAPGQEEDRTGLPFVGPAGKLLDLLLLSAGFPRDSVYICNTLKCRPPQNRNPLPDELAACAHFLEAQLAEIRPRVLLAVGKFAAMSLLGSDASMSQLRGRVHRYAGVPLVVSYHPAYLLRTGSATRAAWEDFQLARKVLDEQA